MAAGCLPSRSWLLLTLALIERSLRFWRCPALARPRRCMMFILLLGRTVTGLFHRLFIEPRPFIVSSAESTVLQQ